MHVFCATSLPFDADAHKLMRPRRRFSQRLNGRRVSAVVEVFAAAAEVHHYIYCAPRQKESQSPLFAAAPPPQPPAVPLSPHHPSSRLGEAAG